MQRCLATWLQRADGLTRMCAGLAALISCYYHSILSAGCQHPNCEIRCTLFVMGRGLPLSEI